MSFLDIQQEMRNDREELMEVETELNGWLGLPADTRLFIQDTIEPVPPPIGYKDLWATILARNINVKSACAQLRAARLNLELAMRDRVPDLAASASYTKTKEVSKGRHCHTQGVGYCARQFHQALRSESGRHQGSCSRPDRCRVPSHRCGMGGRQ